MKAQQASIAEQRAAATLIAEAERAARIAARAGKETVKGMRTVHRFAITDHRAALNWIARNDREALTAFINEYVAKSFRLRPMDGVVVTEEKEAF